MSMPDEQVSICDHVGPCCRAESWARQSYPIRDLNSDVLVLDRGAYLRVLVRQRCVVTRHAIEEHLGRRVRFPGELETVMSAFKGALQLSEDEAIWQFKVVVGER